MYINNYFWLVLTKILKLYWEIIYVNVFLFINYEDFVYLILIN